MAGCSASFSVGSDSKTVQQSDETAFARNFIARYLSDLPPAQAVDCPSDVELKVDTTYECQATLTTGQEVTIPFRITSVNGKNGRAEPNAALVIQALAVEALYKGFDPAVLKSIECPTGVPAVVHKTFDCQVTLKNGRTATATLQVDTATSSGQHLHIVRVHKD
jgi:hypothetical protein